MTITDLLPPVQTAKTFAEAVSEQRHAVGAAVCADIRHLREASSFGWLSEKDLEQHNQLLRRIWRELDRLAVLAGGHPWQPVDPAVEIETTES